MLSWCRRSGKGGGRRELQRGHDAGKQEDVFFIVHLGRRSLYAYRLPLAPRHIHTSIRLINFPTRFTYRAHRQVSPCQYQRRSHPFYYWPEILSCTPPKLSTLSTFLTYEIISNEEVAHITPSSPALIRLTILPSISSTVSWAVENKNGKRIDVLIILEKFPLCVLISHSISVQFMRCW